MKHERELVVFQNGNEKITYGDIVDRLYAVEADQCQVLFVHSDISFGKPATGIKRKELKEILVDALLEMQVETLIFPTFTFSFCNNEDYDIQNSKTTMGMLPEYVRARADAFRTNDPLLSVAIIGKKSGYERMAGTSSCGEGGVFHQLHTCGKKVKFLFFGTLVSKCYTYLHYVEEMQQVPYRYARDFSGKVIDNGNVTDTTVQLYVRYKDVISVGPDDFEVELQNRSIMKKERLGNSYVSAVKERESYDFICSLLKKNPYAFHIPSKDGKWIKEYNYGNVTTL